MARDQQKKEPHDDGLADLHAESFDRLAPKPGAPKNGAAGRQPGEDDDPLMDNEEVTAKVAPVLDGKRAPRGRRHGADYEDGIAEEFVAQHVGDLRYCADFKTWFVWEGVRWRRDKRKLAFHFARLACRDGNRVVSDYVVGTTLYVDGGMTLYPGFATNG